MNTAADQIGSKIIARCLQAGDLQFTQCQKAVVALAVRAVSVGKVDYPSLGVPKLAGGFAEADRHTIAVII